MDHVQKAKCPLADKLMVMRKRSVTVCLVNEYLVSMTVFRVAAPPMENLCISALLRAVLTQLSPLAGRLQSANDRLSLSMTDRKSSCSWFQTSASSVYTEIMANIFGRTSVIELERERGQHFAFLYACSGWSGLYEDGPQLHRKGSSGQESVFNFWKGAAKFIFLMVLKNQNVRSPAEGIS